MNGRATIQSIATTGLSGDDSTGEVTCCHPDAARAIAFMYAQSWVEVGEVTCRCWGQGAL